MLCQMLIIARVFYKTLPCEPHFYCFRQYEDAAFFSVWDDTREPFVLHGCWVQN